MTSAHAHCPEDGSEMLAENSGTIIVFFQDSVCRKTIVSNTQKVGGVVAKFLEHICIDIVQHGVDNISMHVLMRILVDTVSIYGTTIIMTAYTFNIIKCQFLCGFY